MSKLRAMFSIACHSAMNRKETLVWLVLAIALSTISILGIERLRNAAKENFSQAVSGTDLIVGPRSSQVQLLMYSVFRIGEASANMSWPTAQKLAQHPAIAWTIPIALGDSHKGFPVVGTTDAYLKYFQYADKKSLALQQGRWFSELFDVVLGADVAKQLKYGLAAKLTLSHGGADSTGPEHSDKPFRVVGVLAPTGTPVDRSVHISLQALEAIHLGWESGMPGASAMIPAEFVTKFDLTPKSVTAVFVGLKSRVAVFEAQRYIAALKDEPLMAVLPGVALDQLWSLLSIAEKAMLGMALLVGAVSLLSLMAIMLTSLAQRRRELAVLRSIGVSPLAMVALLLLEGALITGLGCVLGYLGLATVIFIAAPWLLAHFGFLINGWQWSNHEGLWLLSLFIVGCLVSVVPGIKAYRQSMADGLLIKA